MHGKFIIGASRIVLYTEYSNSEGPLLELEVLLHTAHPPECAFTALWYTRNEPMKNTADSSSALPTNPVTCRGHMTHYSGSYKVKDI